MYDMKYGAIRGKGFGRGSYIDRQHNAQIAQSWHDLAEQQQRFARLKAQEAAAKWHQMKQQMPGQVRTTCGNCGSTLITREDNTITCGLCRWEGSAYITKDAPIQERHPGVQWCGRCGSGDLNFGAKSLTCKRCGWRGWRWP